MQKSSCQQDGFLHALFRSLRLKMQNSATPQTVAFSLRLHSVKKAKIQSDTKRTPQKFIRQLQHLQSQETTYKSR
ncbi:MAG: hypothetical protein PHX13_06195 [Thiovulaceae bacterium]|nr:hypothetical protein [Sulfurimonadaceae bacterium]